MESPLKEKFFLKSWHNALSVVNNKIQVPEDTLALVYYEWNKQGFYISSVSF